MRIEGPALGERRWKRGITIAGGIRAIGTGCRSKSRVRLADDLTEGGGTTLGRAGVIWLL